MKISEELIAIKMCIKTLSTKIKRIENVNKQLKKVLKDNTSILNVSEKPERKYEQFSSKYGINGLRRIVLEDE